MHRNLICNGDVCPRTALALEQLLDDDVLASASYRFETESTNSDALAEVTAGLAASQLPRLHLADVQTAGRGRQGKQWIAPRDAITLSMIAEADQTTTMIPLSLAVGVGVALAIEHVCAPQRVGLKWPNDLCAHGVPLRKVGGILIEANAAVPNQAVIGIGLNLCDAPELIEGDFPAASLTQLSGRGLDRSEVVAALLESLSEMLDLWRGDEHAILRDYRQRCVLTGKRIELLHRGKMIQGRCDGISDEGALQLEMEGQRHCLHNGEVRSVRTIS